MSEPETPAEAPGSPREQEEIPTGKGTSARGRILSAALGEFADRGFEGATTRSIAASAGVTQPLVHYHFDSKEALWRAAVEHAFRTQRASFEHLGADLRDLDPAARTKVVLRRLVRHAATHPELGRLIALEGARPSPRLSWLAQRFVRPLFQSLWEDVRLGASEGWARPVPPQHLIFIVNAAAAYLFSVPALAREVYDIDVTTPETIDAHADTLVELIFHGLLRESPR